MGKNLGQILAEAREVHRRFGFASVGVVVVTNQDNGIASYANGQLSYRPPPAQPDAVGAERLVSVEAYPLQYLFSDRKHPPPSAGSEQPFSVNAPDRLGLSVVVRLSEPDAPAARFTLLSWGNIHFDVPMQPLGNMLVGIGPPIGGSTDHAVYVVSFTGVVTTPPVR